MGSFVKNLTFVLNSNESEKNAAVEERKRAIHERDAALANIAARVNDLDALKRQDAKSQGIIRNLKADLDRLRASQIPSGIDWLTASAGVGAASTNPWDNSSSKKQSYIDSLVNGNLQLNSTLGSVLGKSGLDEFTKALDSAMKGKPKGPGF